MSSYFVETILFLKTIKILKVLEEFLSILFQLLFQSCHFDLSGQWITSIKSIFTALCTPALQITEKLTMCHCII